MIPLLLQRTSRRGIADSGSRSRRGSRPTPGCRPGRDDGRGPAVGWRAATARGAGETIRWLVPTGLALAIACSQARAEDGGYLRHVKPLFKERCVACHGSLAQEAGLRLDTAALARAGGDDGPVLAPESPDAGLLLERITAADAAGRMPPEGAPLEPAEVAALREWIAAGAPGPADEAPEADPREHWAFRPPLRPTVPELADGARPGNPIDAFLLARLADRGLTPRPEAPPHVLLRRLFLDLVGVPPTPDELEAFLADPSPAAWLSVVERLLTDPRHGERHARHWMDVWRYADWHGRRHVPDVWNSAPQVWRWRDWIVESLNADKGYDRMVQEMLAGDEVAPLDRAAGQATGYLIRNWYALNSNDWMRANVEHTAKAFLGLSFNCAHCHDHKYDPVTQEDYFRMRAFFEPLGVRQDRLPGEADPGPFQEYEYEKIRVVQPLGAVRVFDRDPTTPTWFYTAGDERNRVTERGSIAPGLPAVFGGSLPAIEEVPLPPEAWYPALAPEIRESFLADARAAVARARTALEAVLQPAPAAADALAVVRTVAAQARVVAAEAELASVTARIAADRFRHGDASRPAPPAAAGDAATLARLAVRAERTAALARADADAAGRDVACLDAERLPEDDADRAKKVEAAATARTAAQARLAAARAALADEAGLEDYAPLGQQFPRTSTGRRRALAAWITDRQNPLTARVAVNQVWMRHFHAPLVATVHDFGRNGAAPSHPDLLDWLAVELMEHGWSLRHLHRLIVTSAAYRRDSGSGDGDTQVATDPDNRLLWRMNVGRMEAEVARDSLLALAEMLDPARGGPPLDNSTALTTFRRSLYYECFPEDGGASQFARLFDAPDPLECYRRSVSIVPQQALALTNSSLVHEVSGRIVAAWGKTRSDQDGSSGPATPAAADADFTATMFLRILARPATADELAACLAMLPGHRYLLAAEGSADAAAGARRALVRALVNHNDFITIR